MKCLAEYCTHVSDDRGFDELLWKNCNCCKQKHNNHVLLGISREARKYLADKFPGRKEEELSGLHMIVEAILDMQYSGYTDKDLADEGLATAERIISIAENKHSTLKKLRNQRELMMESSLQSAIGR